MEQQEALNRLHNLETLKYRIDEDISNVKIRLSLIDENFKKLELEKVNE